MNRRSYAIARASAVIGGMGALIVGATMAATNVGTVALTANSFATTSAGLQISSNGTDFSDSATGFNFGTLTPGGDPGTKSNFYLEDTSGGTSPLGVSVAAANVGALTGLDASKVMVNIEKDGGSTVDTMSLADLKTGSLTLSASNDPTVESDSTPVSTKYDVWLTLSSGAVTGTVDTSSDMFDLNFTGTSS